MVALWNTADHYILILSFVLSLIFFPRLISAVADWMTAILPHMVCLSVNLRCWSEMCCTWLAENIGRKKVASNRHLGTIAQVCCAISSQLRHVSTIKKKLVTQQYVLHVSPQCAELGPLAAERLFEAPLQISTGAPHLVVGVSQTLRR